MGWGCSSRRRESSEGISPMPNWGMKESQTLLMGVQCQDKGKQDRKHTILHLNTGKYPLTVSVRQQNRLPRQVVEFPHLKIFKIQLVLTCKQGRVDYVILRGASPFQQFCDLSHIVQLLKTIFFALNAHRIFCEKVLSCHTYIIRSNLLLHIFCF